jgi:hypothetical protein
MELVEMFMNVELLLCCYVDFPAGSAGSNPSEAWLGLTLETSRIESSVPVLRSSFTNAASLLTFLISFCAASFSSAALFQFVPTPCFVLLVSNSEIAEMMEWWRRCRQALMTHVCCFFQSLPCGKTFVTTISILGAPFPSPHLTCL